MSNYEERINKALRVRHAEYLYCPAYDAIEIAKEADTQLAEKDKEIERLKRVNESLFENHANWNAEILKENQDLTDMLKLTTHLNQQNFHRNISANIKLIANNFEVDDEAQLKKAIGSIKVDAIDEMVDRLMKGKHEYNTLLIDDIAEYVCNLQKNTKG